MADPELKQDNAGNPAARREPASVDAQGFSISRLIVSGALKSLAVRISSAAALLLLHVLLARILAAADYGAFNFVVATIGMLALFAQLGLDKSTIRFIPKALAEGNVNAKNQYVRFSARVILSASFAITLAVYLALPALEMDDVLKASLRTGILFLPFLAILQYWQQVLRSLKRILASQIMEQLALPLGVGVIVLGWYLFTGQMYVGTTLTIYLVVLAIGAFAVWRYYCRVDTDRTQRDPQPARPVVSQWLRVSVPLGIAGLMSFLLSRGELILLGLVLNPEDIGLYSVALRLTNLLIFGLAAANAIGGPLFSELFHSNSKSELQRAVSRTAAIALILSAPPALILVLFPVPALTLFGAEYSAATPALLALLVGNMINVVAGPVGPLLTVSGQQNFYLRVLVVTAILKLLIIAPAASAFGVVGAAWAATFTTIVWNAWLALGAYYRLGILPLPSLGRT